jgi:transcriptional regulator with XRE-family HTH domain
MSRRGTSTRAKNQPPLGTWLRQLRRAQKLPLRKVAAAAEIDTTLLSKIELGQRLPTETQTAALARFFAVPADEMQARRIAEKFWQEHRTSKGATRAATLIKEAAADSCQRPKKARRAHNPV